MTTPLFPRRHILSAFALAGGAAALGPPRRILAASPDLAARAHDWDWFAGSWDVWNRRLKQRLAGSTEWEEFGGRSALWQTLGGLGTIDDNLWHMPGGAYHGLGIRAFDPAAGTWAIWWLGGNDPTRVDPPVRGGFDGDGGTFLGTDTFQDRPIKVRFRWHDINSARPHWDQAFSVDDGKTWEINLANAFTRTAATPAPMPARQDAPRDFDFLAGRWDVRHRRRDRTGGWIDFDGTFTNWPVLGGHGNVGDNLMNAPAGAFRGVGFRAYDPKTKDWLSWWLDGRSPADIGPPLRGRFADGVGTFLGEGTRDGRPLRTRVTWSRITPKSARWEQSLSTDGGATWAVDWTSDFRRIA